MTRSPILHAFLFGIFPPLFLLSHNIEECSPTDVIWPVAIGTCATLFLVLLLKAIFHDWNKAGLGATLSILLFSTYGRVFAVAERFSFGSVQLGKHEFLLSLFAGMFLLGMYVLRRTQKPLTSWVAACNVMASSMVMLTLGTMGVYALRGHSGKDALPAPQAASVHHHLSRPGPLPNIYYIILDGYASSKTLRDVYGYDNHEFIDYLTSHGFYVALESHSNYSLTFLSLASSLNMDYINDLTDRVGVQSKNRALPYKLIEKNKAVQLLKSMGYEFVHFGSGWGATARNANADYEVQGGRWNEFDMMLVRTTMMRAFLKFINPVADDARRRVVSAFSKLPTIQRRSTKPQFVFAHIILPHPPYVFDRDGRPISQSDLEMHGRVWKQKQRYLDQLMYCNKQVMTLIESLGREADTMPIVVLQGDHGSASLDEWTHPSEAFFRERMGILNAYYLPADGRKRLYHSISPVNTFRVIFNQYLGTDFSVMPDKSFFSSYERPYDFIDVTQIVDESNRPFRVGQLPFIKADN